MSVIEPTLAEIAAVNRHGNPDLYPEWPHLPPLAGAAPLVGTVYCYPNSDARAKEWTAIGGHETLYEEATRAGVIVPGAKTPSETPGTPTTGNGVKTAVKGDKAGASMENPKEALEREHPGATWLATTTNVYAWLYGNTATTKGYEWIARTLVGGNEQSLQQTNTSNSWNTGGLKITNAALLKAIRENEFHAAEIELIALKAVTCEVFCFLIACEVEYELPEDNLVMVI